MRHFRYFLYIFFLFIFLFSCTKNDKISETIVIEKSVLNSRDLTLNSNGLSQERIMIKTVHGNIYFQFYPLKAPNTVTRILQLINESFYDGLTFHRVIENFVIQGGDPTGKGFGGTGIKLKAEFNSLQHTKGTVAMARAENDIDSADSQFYISLNTLPHLDGKYTIFGQVTEGVEVLHKIARGDKILSMSLVKEK